ncbi:rhodanese-like domain-containing protein [Mucilaginibacter ginkgonis]|uniref:Rhodanese-like domain-containing protein n=1 Tax=Mucilaginibacter ginkgonis TaxID=2682091 RepID=A0A6I4I120_9SPHI|nr:rhodanese-like domain-containing protein [Mucilaginibacter ginkgonis]QQL51192.1 rhodanese-like domain-containing protein [Mucilaginibacter ginkgonis]
MNNPSINAQEFSQRLNNNESLNILDVREAIEYHTYNIGGQNISVSRLQEDLQTVNFDMEDEVIVICKVGKRSETAQSILIQNGYQNVRNLTGGLLALQKLNSNK